MGKPIASAEPNNSLTVRDNRTGKTYNVPYVFRYTRKQFMPTQGGRNHRIVNNSISATDFKAMKATPGPDGREEDETEKGLRVADKGFLNTAVLCLLLSNRSKFHPLKQVMRSQITFIDGAAGGEYIFLLAVTSHSSFFQFCDIGLPANMHH